MRIIGLRKVNYVFSGVLVGLSLAAFLVWGLKLGIDFTGGSLLEVEFAGARPLQGAVAGALRGVGIDSAVIQPTGDRGIIVRTKDLSEVQHQAALGALRELGDVREKQFTSIGPTIGAELKQKSLYAILLVVVMIILYITWAFRQVSRPIASWKYGVAAVIALVHDVTIPTGVFAVLGHYKGIEVDTLFVTALLTTLGFSVHDTIVVFDRIRENLKRLGAHTNFEDVAEVSINQTVVRSIITSFTVMLVMAMLYFFGGISTKYFALAILIGVFFGTYSSIFIASALLVTWQQYSAARARG